MIYKGIGEITKRTIAGIPAIDEDLAAGWPPMYRQVGGAQGGLAAALRGV
jgi:hypothetical protein